MIPVQMHKPLLAIAAFLVGNYLAGFANAAGQDSYCAIQRKRQASKETA